MAENWTDCFLVKVFSGVELLLYLSFLYLDMRGAFTLSSWIKFISITLCFFFITFFSVRRRCPMFIPAALGFSVFSDVFLLFTAYHAVGVASFLIVQLLFLMAMRSYRLFSMKRQLILRGLFSFFVLLLLIILGISIDLTLFLSVFYILFFAFNVGLSFYICKKEKKNRAAKVLTAGLCLFFLCDMQVALFNLSAYVAVHGFLWKSIIDFSAIAMWLFYLPGQVLIGISNLYQKTT